LNIRIQYYFIILYLYVQIIFTFELPKLYWDARRLKKVKAIPLQAWRGPEGSRSLRLPDFNTIWHMKVVRLSALHTGCFYPQEIFLVLISVRG
jgi:hypothetical protein